MTLQEFVEKYESHHVLIYMGELYPDYLNQFQKNAEKLGIDPQKYRDMLAQIAYAQYIFWADYYKASDTSTRSSEVDKKLAARSATAKPKKTPDKGV